MQLEILSHLPTEKPRGVPILFVHGAWHGAWCWEKHFLPYFASMGFAAYAVSLRGHGNSTALAHLRWLRVADYVADVAEAVKTLPETPVLVGHSMGGLVIQKYLETHSAPAAVLMASVPVNGVLRTALRIARRHPLSFLKTNLTWSLYPIIGTPALSREAFFSEGMPENTLRSYFRRLQDESYLAFLDMMVFNLPRPERVSAKLLILGAQDDSIFHTDEVEMTAAAYGTAPEIFSGMAHDMMLEAGWRAVADRIIQWLGEKGIRMPRDWGGSKNESGQA